MIWIKRTVAFLTHDIWRIRAEKLSTKKSIGVRTLRTFILSVKEFGNDQCYLRASALTFYSLLSIVPVFAMAFGVAKGFGMEATLEKRLMESLQGQEEVMNWVIQFARSFLENTKGGVIAGIGVALLFWTVIKMLGNIEKSFNDIWGVKEARTMGRKFSDYLSLMLICPVLIIFSSSVTVFITSQITMITQKVALFGFFSPLIHTGLNLLPYCVLWILLTFLYSFMPNTKVKISSALLGGIIAGTLYQIVQGVYIHFQIGVAKYGAVYGSFAALPLFLIWLQISWLIVLYGAEIAFAKQNEYTYEFEPDCLKVSHAFKRLLSLRISQVCIHNFCEGKEPLTATEIATILEMPIRLVRQLLNFLVEAGVLSEIYEDHDRKRKYLPARPVEQLTIAEVMRLLDEMGLNNMPHIESKELKDIQTCLQDFKRNIDQLSSNILLKDI